jgi:hypothetical protein
MRQEVDSYLEEFKDRMNREFGFEIALQLKAAKEDLQLSFEK